MRRAIWGKRYPEENFVKFGLRVTPVVWDSLFVVVGLEVVGVGV